MNGKAKSWKIWFGIFISIFFFYLFLRGIEWDALWLSIKSVDFFYLILLVAFNLSSFVVRAIRWRYFFSIDKRPSFNDCFSSTAIGFFANSVLPLRIGEVIRAVVLGQKAKISKSTCFGTMVVERLFDMLTILIFFAGFIIIYSLPENTAHAEFVEGIRIAGYTSGLICLIAIIVLIALRFKTDLMLKLINWFTKPLPEKLRKIVFRLVESFIAGLDILKNLPDFLISVFYSIVIWLLIITQTYMIFKAFGLPLTFSQAVFLLVVMVFSVMIPAAPGYVGTFHYGASLALELMGVDSNTAKGVAIVAHIFSMFPITIVGLIYLWVENLSLRDIQTRQLDKTTEDEEE